MKRIFMVVVLISPIGLMLYLGLNPEMDAVYQYPLFHFYIVTFTSFAAAVISILLTASLGDDAQPKHLLAASAFGIMGSVFFSHGAATPNALINYFHPAVQWSAWITLLMGSVIFSLAGIIDASQANARRVVRKALQVITAIVIIYLGIAVFAHDLLDYIGTQATPWHRLAIFYLTLCFWGFATLRLGWLWRKTKGRVDGALVFVSLWLFFATISLHSFQNWRMSWWIYHFLMLISFLVTAILLAQEYEQARRFQLTRYYTAGSLILIAMLALFTSYIFANYSFNSLVNRTRAESETTIKILLDAIYDGLDPESTEITTLNQYAKSLAWQPIGDHLIIYRENGNFFYPFDDYDRPTPIDEENLEFFNQALAGETFIYVAPPGEVSGEYAPSKDVHSLSVFAPLYRPGESEPIGVVHTVRAVPELTNSILSARVTGLIVTVSIMGFLFLALLLVIRRADHILTARADELEKAYTELKRAEILRDDMTNMIVHDLRNPITAISTSLDFIERSVSSKDIDGESTENRFTSIAKNATKRMITLVDDILTVSKFESGELKVNKEIVSVSPFIEKSLENFRSQSEADQKELGYYCPDGVQLCMDPLLVGRVLDNLIANAFKYTDERRGIIEVFIEHKEHKVYFHIRDNGEGIPDAFKQIIFDKFKQIPNNGSERKGTGLGLTFCRMVVETHGGEIIVQDAEGGGSEFIFWLPEN